MANINLYYITTIVIIACGSIPKGEYINLPASSIHLKSKIYVLSRLR